MKFSKQTDSGRWSVMGIPLKRVTWIFECFYPLNLSPCVPHPYALNWHFSLHLPNLCTENLFLLRRNILLGVQFQQTAKNNYIPEITNILLNIAFKHSMFLNLKVVHTGEIIIPFFLIIEWLEQYDCSLYKFDKIFKILYVNQISFKSIIVLIAFWCNQADVWEKPSPQWYINSLETWFCFFLTFPVVIN